MGWVQSYDDENQVADGRCGWGEGVALKGWREVREVMKLVYIGCGGNYNSWCVHIHRSTPQQLLCDNLNILKEIERIESFTNSTSKVLLFVTVNTGLLSPEGQ